MEISYVIPTLNSVSTLDMTILSLKHQEGVKVTILVVDSGSTDGTLDICKRWGVESLYTEPGNMYKAINAGINTFDTEWVAYLNSDDWLYPNSLSTVIGFGDKESADIVYGNCDYVDFSGRLLHSFGPANPSDLPALFRVGLLGFAQQTVIFRRSLYQKLHGFDERYSLAADHDFFSKACKINAKFVKLEGLPVACFRLHASQLSNVKDNELRSEAQKSRLELFGPSTLEDRIIRLKWKASNIFHYGLRVLRQSLLFGRLVIRSSMKV
ncbi:MAG: glycosyltransferase [Cylindrospermopsis raciborskii KL1]|uniref:glycosyltransferase n=1 Tax=Cylindrospermopsis raciborskii TaxID=77022 RepID=UPI001A18DDC8|nr:glycosyltransferase [Cylindrospermopsis raciborskii]MBG0744718.1 glycosyltransferase [Cylindrospermopsis raciborskii KL1]